MSMLLIDAGARLKIAALLAYARAHPVDAMAAMREAQTDLVAFKHRMMDYTIDLHKGVRVTFSLEKQPHGLMRHISISVETINTLPSPAAINMVCQEFGMGDVEAMILGKELSTIAKVWIEEFDSGRRAVNIVQVIAPDPPLVANA